MTLLENKIQIDTFQPVIVKQEILPARVHSLVKRFTALWGTCPSTHPPLGATYPFWEKMKRERMLGRFIDDVLLECQRLPGDENEKQVAQERMMDKACGVAESIFGVEKRHVDVIISSGILDVLKEFAREAHRFDPALSSEDIYQAGRNVMTMCLGQILLGLPVRLTPSIFAYSMLYPYSDNYLDDPDISRQCKLTFSERFERRLRGEDITPANAHEKTICNLVGMIESEYDRSAYPLVFESLLAIHGAQTRSMRQLRRSASPEEVDILEISFEKGGTSVLADGYLVAGDLTEDQAKFMFGYGSFTQLMDDLEDVEQDRQDGSMTLFSQKAGEVWLDAVTNRVFHYGTRIFSLTDAFTVPEAPALKEMILKGVNPLLSISAANANRFYSTPYLQQLEAHMPVRFKYLEKQRKKLENQKVTLTRLFESFAWGTML